MPGILKQVKRSIKHWWLFVLLGVFLIIGGIWCLMTPLESYITLAIFFSAMVFVNGVFDVAFSLANSKVLKGWGWHLAGGVFETLIGIVLMIHPALTMSILPLMLGFWLMFGAVSTISGSFDLRSYNIKGWGWMLVLGILLMFFSFLVLANPLLGSVVIVYMISFAIISYGVSYIVFGLQLKKVKDFAGDVKENMAGNIEHLKKEVIAAIESASDGKVNAQDIKKKFDEFKASMS